MKLANGARLFVAPQEGTEAASILVLFKVGSRNESLKVWGGAHVLEHMMFKGTKRRKTTVDVTRELERYGAAYNAYTGKDITGYWVKIEAKQLPTAIDVLEDILFHSTFDPKEMAKEKKAIVEEIKMYEENPMMHVGDLLEDLAYEGHELGRNIAGTAESVLKMKRDDLMKFREAYYTPENMVVVLAGKVDKKVIDLAKKKFGAVKGKKVGAVPTPYTAEHPKGIRVTRQEKDLAQVRLAMSFPTVGRHHEDSTALRLLTSILGGGSFSSRLFMEVREKRGLCYDIHAGVEQFDDTGILTIGSGLDVKRLPLALNVIMGEVKKMAAKGVTAKELAMAKDNLEGKLALHLEDASDRAEFFGRRIVYHGDVETIAERIAKYRAVTTKDIARVAKKYLTLEAIDVAIIGPYKTDEEVQKLVADAVGKSSKVK